MSGKMEASKKRDVAIVGVVEADTVAVGRQPGFGRRERGFIDVEADEPRPGVGLEDGHGVPGQAERAVDVRPGTGSVEEFERLLQENRDMSLIAHSSFPGDMMRAMFSKSLSVRGLPWSFWSSRPLSQTSR